MPSHWHHLDSLQWLDRFWQQRWWEASVNTKTRGRCRILQPKQPLVWPVFSTMGSYLRGLGLLGLPVGCCKAPATGSFCWDSLLAACNRACKLFNFSSKEFAILVWWPLLPYIWFRTKPLSHILLFQQVADALKFKKWIETFWYFSIYPWHIHSNYEIRNYISKSPLAPQLYSPQQCLHFVFLPPNVLRYTARGSTTLAGMTQFLRQIMRTITLSAPTACQDAGKSYEVSVNRNIWCAKKKKKTLDRPADRSSYTVLNCNAILLSKWNVN